MTLDVAGRHYEQAEDERRMRRLDLFVAINKRRDLLRKRGLLNSGDEQLRKLEREYAELMAASRAQGFGR